MFGIRARTRSVVHAVERALGQAREHLDVFVHLPKCGGMSLRAVIRANYARARTHEVSLPSRRSPITDRTVRDIVFSLEALACPDTRALVAHLGRVGHDLDVVLGHVPYGVHRFVARPCRYFSVVRDPVERAWSAYNHVLSRPHHHLYAVLARHGFDLVRALESGDLFEVIDDQTRMLLGIQTLALDASHADQVCALIERTFLHVGVMERYPEALATFARLLGWKRSPDVRENVGAYEKVPARPSQRWIDAIEAHNAVDRALYAFVRERSRRVSSG